jgi:SEC-C motif-containing protein
MPKRAVAPAEPKCPCGSGNDYPSCCARWHSGPLRLSAPTAEALMRSRYSAYALGLHDYLLETQHERTRPSSIAPQPSGLTWIGLEVRKVQTLDDDHATVEFVARSKIAGRAERMHVTSRFERLEGRWFYVDDA